MIIFLIIVIIILLELFPIYRINTSITTFPKKDGRIFLCTHNYEHKDIFIMLREASFLNERVYMIFADKIWNKALENFRYTNTRLSDVLEYMQPGRGGGGPVPEGAAPRPLYISDIL